MRPPTLAPRGDGRQLAHTRRLHLCPRCYHYAYHRGQTEVRVGARIHHSACPILRAAPRVRTGADAAPTGDAPPGWPILATAVGIFAGTLRYVKAKGP